MPRAGGDALDPILVHFLKRDDIRVVQGGILHQHRNRAVNLPGVADVER
jgi:hypothetical protein